MAYWTFDEGVSTLPSVYDYSKTGEQQNNNDAKLIGGVRSNITIPSPDQLSLFGMTDTKGAYTVSGIPFMGAGTTYSIIPTKGVHKFNPTKRTVYVSPTTLTFDPQNFNDESSFNVKGVVYFENTTYPVKDCTFRVDDVVVKDERGNLVKTNENGEFTIPVSIGDHVLYVEKKGHTFLNAGRYPRTGMHNFNDSISHLTFTDMTKAIVALVLSSFPIGSIVAIVMGHSNRTAILDYLDRGGMHTGKIKASSIMSRAAFFLGIGLTIFYGIYFVILLFMCAAMTN